jgi:predicted ATPase
VRIQLEVEGVRCFAKKQSAEIRPLTLLVGENSSGKSTFLALCEIASAMARGELAKKTGRPKLVVARAS